MYHYNILSIIGKEITFLTLKKEDCKREYDKLLKIENEINDLINNLKDKGLDRDKDKDKYTNYKNNSNNKKSKNREIIENIENIEIIENYEYKKNIYNDLKKEYDNFSYMKNINKLSKVKFDYLEYLKLIFDNIWMWIMFRDFFIIMYLDHKCKTYDDVLTFFNNNNYNTFFETESNIIGIDLDLLKDNVNKWYKELIALEEYDIILEKAIKTIKKPEKNDTKFGFYKNSDYKFITSEDVDFSEYDNFEGFKGESFILPNVISKELYDTGYDTGSNQIIVTIDNQEYNLIYGVLSIFGTIKQIENIDEKHCFWYYLEGDSYKNSVTVAMRDTKKHEYKKGDEILLLFNTK